MLDPEAPEERRNAIASQARSRLEQAEVKHDAEWGVRQLAYEIASRTEADYRYLRFACEPDVLPELEHSLRITDELLRFRLFKVDPAAPTDAPPVGAQPPPGSRGGSRREGQGRGPRRSESSEAQPAAQAPAEPSPEPEAPTEQPSPAPEASEAEAPAEPPPETDGGDEPADPAAASE